jgi:hypothetical protein
MAENVSLEYFMNEFEKKLIDTYNNTERINENHHNSHRLCRNMIFKISKSLIEIESISIRYVTIKDLI